MQLTLKNGRQLIFCFLLITLFSFQRSTKDEPKGYAIIISVPKVNNDVLRRTHATTYEETYADLPGASSDGKTMTNILLQEGFAASNIIRLGGKTSDTISEEQILATFKTIASKIKPNDLFVFYYSGHGASVKDQPGGDEADGKDEAFVTYKSYLLDDKINEIYKKYFSATRNIMIIDACHGGSMQEFTKKTIVMLDNKANSTVPIKLGIPGCTANATTLNTVGFNMIYYGASRDENNGFDTGAGGYFTLSFSRVHHPVYGKNIKPRELACKISNDMQILHDPGKGEIQYTECGTLSEEFKNSYLFKIK